MPAAARGRTWSGALRTKRERHPDVRSLPTDGSSTTDLRGVTASQQLPAHRANPENRSHQPVATTSLDVSLVR